MKFIKRTLLLLTVALPLLLTQAQGTQLLGIKNIQEGGTVSFNIYASLYPQSYGTFPNYAIGCTIRLQRLIAGGAQEEVATFGIVADTSDGQYVRNPDTSTWSIEGVAVNINSLGYWSESFDATVSFDNLPAGVYVLEIEGGGDSGWVGTNYAQLSGEIHTLWLFVD